jgi:tetratricopeptide (TPR) repeat protein
VGEGAASAALAHSFKMLGDQKLALKYLETFLEIAQRTKQARSEAEACTGLGTIYSSLGEHAKAVSFFEQTFEIARTLGDRRLMDGARINLVGDSA